MTSLSALRNAKKSEEGESPTLYEIRVEEVKEAYIEGELDEMEFDELLDAAMDSGAPYRASVLLNDDATKEVPTPDDVDEHVIENRGKYFTIDGSVARERDVPEWENVVNVLGNGSSPDEDEITIRSKKSGPISEKVLEKQEELRREILG